MPSVEKGAIKISTANAMGNILNKKMGVSTGFAPKDWADTLNLCGKAPEKTVSGAIAHLTDGADEVPLKSWGVTLPASLDGYSEIGCTKNTVNFFNEDWEVGGINDGTGVPNSDTDKIRSKTFSIMKGGATYYAKAPNNIRVLFYASDYSFISETVNIMNTTFTAPSNCVYFKIRGTVAYGTTYNNDISINASGDTDYHAYTAPTTATASLGRTIYGGTADVVNGTGTEDFDHINMGSLTWQYDSANTRFFTVGLTSVIEKGSSGWKTELVTDLYTTASGTANDKTISEYASTGYVYIKDTDYSDPTQFKNHVSGHYLVYPLATATAFTFTPITPTPETALGVNNFWADEGDSQVTYRRDIDLALGE